MVTGMNRIASLAASYVSSMYFIVGHMHLDAVMEMYLLTTHTHTHESGGKEKSSSVVMCKKLRLSRLF